MLTTEIHGNHVILTDDSLKAINSALSVCEVCRREWDEKAQEYKSVPTGKAMQIDVVATTKARLVPLPAQI